MLSNASLKFNILLSQISVFPLSFHKKGAMTFHVLSSAYGENLYRDWETLDEER